MYISKTYEDDYKNLKDIDDYVTVGSKKYYKVYSRISCTASSVCPDGDVYR